MNPLQNENVRLAVGLLDATVLLVVAFVFLDSGPVRWAAVAIALVSVAVVPWVLGRAAENAAAAE